MLGLSIFDTDSTLGTLAGARRIVLEGSLQVSQLFSPNFFPIDTWIKTALHNKGFSVIGVRTSAAGWIGYDRNVELEIEVYNEFSAEDARINAIAAIEAYTANWGLNKVFSNTTLRVTYDASSDSSNYSGSYDYSKDKNTTPEWLDKFAEALGLSTPMAIVVGGIVLLLVWRR